MYFSEMLIGTVIYLNRDRRVARNNNNKKKKLGL